LRQNIEVMALLQQVHQDGAGRQTKGFFSGLKRVHVPAHNPQNVLEMPPQRGVEYGPHISVAPITHVFQHANSGAGTEMRGHAYLSLLAPGAERTQASNCIKSRIRVFSRSDMASTIDLDPAWLV
jgi:hypothetical protein